MSETVTQSAVRGVPDGAGSAYGSGWNAVRIPVFLLFVSVVLWSATYAFHFRQMASIWLEGGDMVHGPLVPFAAGYMAWLRRDELARLNFQPNWWGFALVVWSALQSTVALIADWRFPGFITFWISLVGCILFLYGLPAIRVLLYPLVVLLLMIPPPSFLYDRITLGLQLISSALSEKTLEALGYSVLREGNILEMLGERLSVAEACSGIRALIALIFFCSIYTFFFVTNPILKVVLWASTVPFAIAGNTFRIVLTGVGGQYNRAFLHGTLHDMTGYLSIVFSGLLCVGLHNVCERVIHRGEGRRIRAA